MKRILFLRRYGGRHGGHITVRDFFMHSLEHPQLDPYVYFTPESDKENDIWAPVPRDRFVPELDHTAYDLLFVAGRTWRFLPKDLGDQTVINLILHVRHATNPAYRKFLERPAFRIANSQDVFNAVADLANGPTEIIHESVDFSMFPRDAPKVPGSVFIFGQKNPALCEALTLQLKQDGVDVTSFVDSVPQVEFAKHMAQAEIFVALPHRTEGGYRPPLEAMACGAALICSDAVGPREYVIADQTCLQPGYSDFPAHLEAVRRLLSDDELRGRLVANGLAMAAEYSREHQRDRFHSFVDRYVFAD